MNVLIYSPAPSGSTRGNRITAQRWAELIRSLGHEVHIAEPDSGSLQPGANPVDFTQFDVLVGLHAAHSASFVKDFAQACPNKPVFVSITGTDLFRDLLGNSRQRAQVVESLDLADRIIVLEPECRKHLTPEWLEKTVVIFQSATPVEKPTDKNRDAFVVTVVGHLRPVKDPFLTALALKLLPPESRIRVIQFGVALDAEMKKAAEQLASELPRYEWRGSVSHEEAQRQLAASHLTILSSISEGAPSVISEAVVNNVPILATRITASIGLLGDDYPGMFPVGDEEALAELLVRAETDSDFYEQLRSWISRLKSRFDPHTELAAWKELLDF